MAIQKIFLTFLGTGLIPKAPKTAATLAALVLGVILLHYVGTETLFMLTLAVTVIGIFEIDNYENSGKTHHAQEVVIDAAAGMWSSLMIAASTAAGMEYPSVNALAVLFSFAAYRLFDIWKPSTVGWMHRELKGGLGIMLSSLLAGIAAGMLSALCLMGIETVVLSR